MQETTTPKEQKPTMPLPQRSKTSKPETSEDKTRINCPCGKSYDISYFITQASILNDIRRMIYANDT